MISTFASLTEKGLYQVYCHLWAWADKRPGAIQRALSIEHLIPVSFLLFIDGAVGSEHREPKYNRSNRLVFGQGLLG